MEEILERVKDKVRPGKTHMKHVERTVKKLNKALDDNDVNAECMVGGSFAKNTHLKGDHDVDLFVRFNFDDYKRENISAVLEDVMPFDYEKLNGSRDYFQVERYDLTFEIVPVLKVDDPNQAKNVTDMSPLHVEYVRSHDKGGLNEEIRLAKQFCKANRVYGAESYIQGFSGHVIDLLIAYHGSFVKLIKAAANWKNRVVIDMESHWSNPLRQLNDSKLQSPLVLVDPIQPERNAAAALSREKFDLFKTRCKQFLEEPSEDFFIIRNLDFEDLEKKSGEDYFIALEAWPYKDKEDVMGAKMRQVYEYFYRKFTDRKWPVVEADWEFVEEDNKARIYFIIDNDVKSYIDRRGPPVEKKSDVKKFIKKHKNTYVSGGRMYARIDRRYDTPREFLEDMVDHKYVQERVKKTKFLED